MSPLDSMGSQAVAEAEKILSICERKEVNIKEGYLRVDQESLRQLSAIQAS